MDNMAGKYSLIFKKEYLLALAILGCTRSVLRWSFNDYEAFRFETESVKIIFYPHKTKSTGNLHIRVRDGGSSDKVLARQLMDRLYKQSKDISFSRNNQGYVKKG